MALLETMRLSPTSLLFASRQSLHDIFRDLGNFATETAAEPSITAELHEEDEQDKQKLASPSDAAKALLSPMAPPSSKRRRILNPAEGFVKRMQTPLKDKHAGEEFYPVSASRVN